MGLRRKTACGQISLFEQFLSILVGKTPDIKNNTMKQTRMETLFCLKEFGEKEPGMIWRDDGGMDNPKMVV
jgi:hypothetical protein